jgi:hypothetical protein
VGRIDQPRPPTLRPLLVPFPPLGCHPRGVSDRRILGFMTNAHEFAILSIRQIALENEADAARLVEELAAERGIEGAWERTQITNLGAEGTDQAIRFPTVSQAALKAAVDASPNSARITHYFLVLAP